MVKSLHFRAGSPALDWQVVISLDYAWRFPRSYAVCCAKLCQAGLIIHCSSFLGLFPALQLRSTSTPAAIVMTWHHRQLRLVHLPLRDWVVCVSAHSLTAKLQLLPSPHLSRGITMPILQIQLPTNHADVFLRFECGAGAPRSCQWISVRIC